MTWLARTGRILFSPGMAVLAALLVGYMLLYRFTLPYQGAEFGAVEVVGLFASDPYYLLYVVAPAWLLAVVLSIRREAEPQVVIRDGSRRRWLTRVLLRSTTPRLAAAAIVVVPVWAFAGIGFLPTTDWVMFREHSNSTFFSAALGPTGLSPFGLIGSQALTFVTAAIAGAATIATVYVLTGSTGIAAMVAVVMFVAPIVGHVLAFLPVGPLALFSLENYVSPLAAQTSFGAWWAGAVVCVVWTIALVALVAAADRQQASVKPTMRFGYVGYAITAGLLIVGVVATSPQAHHDLLHSLRFTFQGAAPGGSALLPYLVATAVFLAPAYLASAAFEYRLGGLIFYELIRHGTYRRTITRQLFQSLFVAVIVLVGAALVATVTWAAVTSRAGKPVSDQLTLDPGVAGYIFFVNGILQLLFYVALSILLIWISGRSTTALIGLGVIVVVGFFPFAPWPLLPVYLNSLNYVTTGWAGALTGTAILLTAITATLATLALYARRRGLTV